jgi:hypothetical protein
MEQHSASENNSCWTSHEIPRFHNYSHVHKNQILLHVLIQVNLIHLLPPIFTLSSHLCLGLPSNLFHLGISLLKDYRKLSHCWNWIFSGCRPGQLVKWNDTSETVYLPDCQLLTIETDMVEKLQPFITEWPKAQEECVKFPSCYVPCPSRTLWFDHPNIFY